VDKRRQISAIKTIILTSGSTFMTIFPMSAIRLGVLSSGISVLDLELRRKPLFTILFRVSDMLLKTTSSSLNPLFYLAMRKNLRDGLPCVKWFRGRMRAMGRAKQSMFEPSHSVMPDNKHRIAIVE